MKHLHHIALGLSITLSAGCAPKTGLYYWGGYEDQIHNLYVSPEKASPEMQAAKLEADIEKAKAQSKPLPPGFHAHLGYEYAISGRKDLAVQQLTMEKEQYPESAIYMDLLMKQLQPKQD